MIFFIFWVDGRGDLGEGELKERISISKLYATTVDISIFT